MAKTVKCIAIAAIVALSVQGTSLAHAKHKKRGYAISRRPAPYAEASPGATYPLPNFQWNAPTLQPWPCSTAPQFCPGYHGSMR
jgi:hypothetical protein